MPKVDIRPKVHLNPSNQIIVICLDYPAHRTSISYPQFAIMWVEEPNRILFWIAVINGATGDCVARVSDMRYQICFRLPGNQGKQHNCEASKLQNCNSFSLATPWGRDSTITHP